MRIILHWGVLSISRHFGSEVEDVETIFSEWVEEVDATGRDKELMDEIGIFFDIVLRFDILFLGAGDEGLGEMDVARGFIPRLE